MDEVIFDEGTLATDGRVDQSTLVAFRIKKIQLLPQSAIPEQLIMYIAESYPH
jgi:hypothetical protein